MTDPARTPETEPRTEAGRETHALLHRLSSQMKTCEMVPCPFAGLMRRVEARSAGTAPLDVERLARALGLYPQDPELRLARAQAIAAEYARLAASEETTE